MLLYCRAMIDQRNERDDLVLALAAGEESAFQELLSSLGPRLHRAATRLLGSREDADDAVQEVFISLVRSREKLLEVKSLPAYSFVVLYRIVGRSLKNRQRQPGLACYLDDHAAPTSTSADVDEEALNLAVQSLPAQQREIVVLRTDGGLTFAEISELLGVNANTVASRYRYALNRLREELRTKSC